jgi:hypothetical protein
MFQRAINQLLVDALRQGPIPRDSNSAHTNLHQEPFFVQQLALENNGMVSEMSQISEHEHPAIPSFTANGVYSIEQALEDLRTSNHINATTDSGFGEQTFTLDREDDFDSLMQSLPGNNSLGGEDPWTDYFNPGGSNFQNNFES